MPLIFPEEMQYRQRLEDQLGEYTEMQARHSRLQYFNDALKSVDPLLELVRASEQATDPALIPGLWHIRRNNETTVPTYYPICDHFGNFKEPGMEDIEKLRSLDASRFSFDEMIDKKRLDDKRRAEYDADQRRGEIADLYRTFNTPSIRVSKDIK